MSKKNKGTTKSRSPNTATSQKKKKHKYIALQNLIPILISLFAAIIALGGVLYTKNTYELALEQANEEKSAVWLSKVNQESNEVAFATNNENIAMQFARINFPEPFADSDREILFPEFSLPTSVLIMDLEKHLESKHNRQEGYATVVEGNIPFVLQSYYVVKGSSYSIQSLYHLRYLVTMGEQEGSFPSFEIKDFWFDRHLDPNDDPKEALKKVWKNGNYNIEYMDLE